MEEKVMSIQDWEQIESHLDVFLKQINNFRNDISEAIKVFNNTEIVQSFYESGTFGKEMQSELLKIRDAVERYYASLLDSNGLIPITKSVIESQKTVLNKSYNGGE